MMDYWTNFARTGDPNGKGLPSWPPYDSQNKMIQLDSTITSGPDALRPQYIFLMK
jgi:para-nitrobenzyl esterase